MLPAMKTHLAHGLFRSLYRSALVLAAATTVNTATTTAFAADATAPALKTESFDKDPGWEEHQNRVEVKKAPVVKQDFGYSATQHASASTPGEIGGSITRTTRPAYYGLPIPPRTLDHKLSASGTFAVTKSQPGGGLFFGWFNAKQPGGMGRPIGSLGLHLDFEGSGGRLAVRLITGTNQSCGTFITPYLPGKYRTTPIKNDGTRYQWTLDYDPAGASGNGAFTFTLKSDTHPMITVDTSLPAASQEEELARFPTTKTFTVDLPAGYKQQATTVDRFGMMNMMKAGGTTQIYFADLKQDGEPIDLSKEPTWIAQGNRDSYEDRELVGAHNFGYSAKTNHAAGSKPGELGGDFWRSGNYAYVGDRVGPFDANQRLEARGRVCMLAGGPDADMMLGFFSSRHRDKSPIDAGDFLGIAVGGPTRVGHYFAPYMTNSSGERNKVDTAPLLVPGKTYAWSMAYEPTGNGGNGEVKVTLGDESMVLPLKPGRKKDGLSLDRFGMFTSQAGGQLVRIYLDDLVYSAGVVK
jgi:hypothetical protein